MLTIVILITASYASAAPQGTVIKGGVLTYPAGPYLTEDPLLLSLENYTGDNYTQSLTESLKRTYPENECLFFDKDKHDTTQGNLSTGIGINPCSPFYMYNKPNTERLNSGFSFFGYSPFFNKKS
jgi:hypothetical protein